MAKTKDTTFYQALLRRDANYDGHFFVAVHTTKIYCRSICPARKPLFKNVSFFITTAEAEAAGFRACKRCRPEAAPGSPAWMGTSTTVKRALRFIRNGETVSGISERLGMSDRRLRQLFQQHLGTSPVTVATQTRAQLAKSLIRDSKLTFTEIAFASGFKSLRRFNAVVKENFGKSPTELRERKRI